MIELTVLQDMFTNMRADTDWNVDGPLLWGYFFTDRAEAKLRAFAPLLEAQGYRLVGINAAEVDDGEPPFFVLHAEKVETHSAQTLHERNAQWYALADLHQLDSYDGMDVGPVGDAIARH